RHQVNRRAQGEQGAPERHPLLPRRLGERAVVLRPCRRIHPRIDGIGDRVVIGRTHQEAGRGLFHAGQRARFGLTGTPYWGGLWTAKNGDLRLEIQDRAGAFFSVLPNAQTIEESGQNSCFLQRSGGWFSGLESAIYREATRIFGFRLCPTPMTRRRGARLPRTSALFRSRER